MGLDMYLKSMPKLQGYSFEKLVELDDKLRECEFDSLNSMKGIIPYVKKVGKYITWYSISEQIAYWRKANHIHRWFVNIVQGGEDECNPYEVTKEHIIMLLNDVKTVLEAKDKEDGISVAQEVLPTQSGFFFGSTEYTEWYYQVLEETKTILEKILETFDFENNYLFYISSW